MDPQDMTSSSDPCQCPKELPKILEKRRRKEKQRCLAHSLVGECGLAQVSSLADSFSEHLILCT